MKYIKTYKIFESITHSDIEKVKELFYNLSDDVGYSVDVKYANCIGVDFSKTDIVNSSDIGYTDPIATAHVTIRKYGHAFNIDDVMDDVEVAISYANEVLGFKVYNIYVSSPPSYLYYKSINSMFFPKNKMIGTLSIDFVKK